MDSCKMEDYKSFLHCVTDGGQRDYTACCRKRSVPPFCFEFCANNFKVPVNLIKKLNNCNTFKKYFTS